jgi:hypothetical protein
LGPMMSHQRAKRRDQVAVCNNPSPSDFGHTAGGPSDPALYSHPLARQFRDHRLVQPQLRAKLDPIAGGTNRGAIPRLIGTGTFEFDAAGQASVAVLAARLARPRSRFGPRERLEPESAIA